MHETMYANIFTHQLKTHEALQQAVSVCIVLEIIPPVWDEFCQLSI